jgi:hypothetical protein
MKGKLIKLNVGVGYRLDDEHGNLFASTLQSSKTKLSIQNCDEIFGIVYSQQQINKKLNDYHVIREAVAYYNENKYAGKKVEDAFIKGSEYIVKILLLEQSKLFTLEDMRTAMLNAIEMTDFQKEQFRKDNDYHIALDIIQSLQQPTEIDVEVVMDKIPADLAPGGWDVFPKLDEEGCLILKRVIC